MTRPFTNKLTITRFHKYELDEAIKDLLKRGYEVVDRGVEAKDVKQFGFNTDTRGHKLKFSGSDLHQKYWARLRKTDITSELVPSVACNVN